MKLTLKDKEVKPDEYSFTQVAMNQGLYKCTNDSHQTVLLSMGTGKKDLLIVHTGIEMIYPLRSTQRVLKNGRFIKLHKKIIIDI